MGVGKGPVVGGRMCITMPPWGGATWWKEGWGERGSDDLVHWNRKWRTYNSEDVTILIAEWERQRVSQQNVHGVPHTVKQFKDLES